MAELRRLLVDGRPVAHPTARNRGIGRYTLGLLRGLREVGAPVTAVHETDEEAELLLAAIPGLHVQRLRPAAVRAEATDGSAWFLATQLMLHPIPLDPVPRIVTEAGLPVAAVMYDVIPERYPELYQVRPQARAQVQLRGALARTLDVLLAISRFAADTAATELRFPHHRIAVIGAGVEPQFVPASTDPWPLLDGVLADDGRQVVLMVSGGDTRKNTERLLQAWGRVPLDVRRAHRLVIVGAANPLLMSTWQRWAADAGVSGDVDLLGGLADAQIVALHQLAALAVMPSLEEGFGLPVLEAAACGCPVITSNRSSLPEVLGEPAAEFDPYDTDSIAASLHAALVDERLRDRLRAAGASAAQRWTWARTATAVVASLEEIRPSQQRTSRLPGRRIALAGRFDTSVDGRANTELAEAVAALSTGPVVQLLAEEALDATPQPTTLLRFPRRAMPRSVHPSQFDRVIELTGDGNGARSARLDGAAFSLAGTADDAQTLLARLASIDDAAG